MLISARKQFSPIASSFQNRLSWKTSLLLKSEIVWEFANTLTFGDKYSLNVKENFGNQFKINYLRNQKRSVEFSLRFWNLHQILNILK